MKRFDTYELHQGRVHDIHVDGCPLPREFVYMGEDCRVGRPATYLFGY
jgi:hypothetical protein